MMKYTPVMKTDPHLKILYEFNDSNTVYHSLLIVGRRMFYLKIHTMTKTVTPLDKIWTMYGILFRFFVINFILRFIFIRAICFNRLFMQYGVVEVCVWLSLISEIQSRSHSHKLLYTEHLHEIVAYNEDFNTCLRDSDPYPIISRLSSMQFIFNSI